MEDPENHNQLGFELGDASMSSSYAPNLFHVREDLSTILEEARSSVDSSPWDTRTFRYKKIVFLQMTKWLPEDEAEQFRFDFMQEVERIEQLLAA
jgi:hypothetical protein